MLSYTQSFSIFTLFIMLLYTQFLAYSVHNAFVHATVTLYSLNAFIGDKNFEYRNKLFCCENNNLMFSIMINNTKKDNDNCTSFLCIKSIKK